MKGRVYNIKIAHLQCFINYDNYLSNTKEKITQINCCKQRMQICIKVGSKNGTMENCSSGTTQGNLDLRQPGGNPDEEICTVCYVLANSSKPRNWDWHCCIF